MNAFAILLPVIFPIIAGYDFPLQQQIVSGTACGWLIQDFRYDGISALDSHNDLCL